MAELLRVLLVEDSEEDAELTTHALQRGGFAPIVERVETEERYQAALQAEPEIIISDHSLPQFDSFRALALLQALGLDTPFIIVSGTIGEELAIEAMHRGAADYVLKDRLARLPESVRHALEQHHLRAERRLAEAALRESEERFRTLVQHGSDIIAVLDPSGVIQYVSPSVEQVLGYRPDELVGNDAFGWVHAEDLDGVWARFTQQGAAGANSAIEFRMRHRDGSWRWLAAISQRLLHVPSVHGLVINAHDITVKRQLAEELSHRVFYDTLTGLPNRALFLDRLSHALAWRAATQHATAVLFLDLDRFTAVNDAFGHGAGDELLVAVAERLRGCLQPSDTLARFGGDEFAIVLSEEGSAQAATLADTVLAQFQDPFLVGEREVFTNASIGIALAGGPHETAANLLRAADAALHHAKQVGRGGFVLFSPALAAHTAGRLSLEADLRRALERNEFVVHYQPVIDLQTGSVCGTEALVRWQHPQRGRISPGDFIPLAEESGLIIAIDRWVLQEACRQAVRWQRSSWSAGTQVMSVNCSARGFQQATLVEEVAQALASSGLAPSALCIEITESTMMQSIESAGRTLRALKRLGVRLAIDDFGTGYSSLSYLTRFPADTLKVDRSFISDLYRDPNAAAIVEAVVALARGVAMDVTVEGVEDQEQLAFTRRIGCTRAQGFYFARPLPAQDLGLLLRRGSFDVSDQASSVPETAPGEAPPVRRREIV